MLANKMISICSSYDFNPCKLWYYLKSLCFLQISTERQRLHDDHKRTFQEEFGKYIRAATVNRSTSMQSVLFASGNIRVLRRVPDLFSAMVDRDNSIQLP